MFSRGFRTVRLSGLHLDDLPPLWNASGTGRRTRHRLTRRAHSCAPRRHSWRLLLKARRPKRGLTGTEPRPQGCGQEWSVRQGRHGNAVAEDWTAPLRARLCSEPSLEADLLKGVGLDLVIELKLDQAPIVAPPQPSQHDDRVIEQRQPGFRDRQQASVGGNRLDQLGALPIAESGHPKVSPVGDSPQQLCRPRARTVFREAVIQRAGMHLRDSPDRAGLPVLPACERFQP